MNTTISSISSQITNNIFSKVDSKNQGYIGKSDLTDALGKANTDAESVDTEALFKSMDTDSDGKITKSEMSTQIESLLGQLTSSMQSAERGQMGPPSGMRPDEAGVTKEQATEIASSTDDENLSSIMTDLSENFEAADANQDGKVSMQEGIKYREASQSESNSASTGSHTNQANELKMRMAQLIEAYGLGTSEESTSLYAAA